MFQLAIFKSYKNKAYNKSMSKECYYQNIYFQNVFQLLKSQNVNKNSNP